MRLVIRALGLDLLDIDLSTDAPEAEGYGSELAGGTLASDRIEAGTTSLFMGFTNGLEDVDE